MDDDDLLLTTAEAAELLRLSLATLAQMRMRRGGGPRYLKLGRGKGSKVLYRKSEIMRWLESREYGLTAEYGRD